MDIWDIIYIVAAAATGVNSEFQISNHKSKITSKKTQPIRHSVFAGASDDMINAVVVKPDRHTSWGGETLQRPREQPRRRGRQLQIALHL